jgi:Tfp pilus assembly protein PilN
MLEINLLPEDRRPDDTIEPERLAIMVAGVLVAGVLGVVIAYYYLVAIPVMKDEIKNRESDIKRLKDQKAEIDKIIAQIETLNKKVQTLDTLTRSRVRYGRLFEVFSNAVPAEGLWLKTMNIQPEAGAVSPGGGKRYVISMTGYAVGSDAMDRRNRLAEFLTKLEDLFVKNTSQVDPKTGVHKFLQAKFNPPRLVATNLITLPVPPAADLEVLKDAVLPKQGLDFSMTISFELAPAQQPGT